jgi:hypothetical protein
MNKLLQHILKLEGYSDNQSVPKAQSGYNIGMPVIINQQDATRNIAFENSTKNKIREYNRAMDPNNQPHFSQWNPKPGEREALAAKEAERLRDYNSWDSRFSRNPHVIKGTKNLADAGDFALTAMTAGEGALLLKGLVKPAIKIIGKNVIKNAEKKILSETAKDVTKAVPKPKLSIQSNVLKDELEAKNIISKSEIDAITRREYDWVNSPEYAKRRMDATGETSDQIAASVAGYNEKAGRTKIAVGPTIRKTVSAQYVPEQVSKPSTINKIFGVNTSKDPKIVVNENLSRNKALGSIEHETNHAFSQVSDSDFKYKGYPKIKLGNWFERNIPGIGDHTKYLNEAYEQQVRGQGILRNIEDMEGISRGTQLTEKNLASFLNKVKPGTEGGKQFAEKYPDIINFTDQISKKYGKDIKYPARQRLLDFLNKSYVVPGAVGAAGVIGAEQKAKGGPILDPRGQWAYPGEVTRIPGSDITMKGVNYPVMGIGNNGMKQVMEPGGEYDFRDADYVDEYPMMKGGGYVVTRSSDRKGKTHKVTGPDGTVKYFGDSKLGQHPNDPERKKAFYARHKKNLAGNPYFRAFARKTWEEGGQTDDDREMLSGVADILRRINDTSNRKEVANYMMDNFREEDVSFQPNAFLKSANVFGKGGEMIRRKDGSYSKRGLWDNIRANAGSGKKPTKQMLEQERKIRSKQEGGEEVGMPQSLEELMNPTRRGTANVGFGFNNEKFAGNYNYSGADNFKNGTHALNFSLPTFMKTGSLDLSGTYSPGKSYSANVSGLAPANFIKKGAMMNFSGGFEKDTTPMMKNVTPSYNVAAGFKIPTKVGNFTVNASYRK